MSHVVLTANCAWNIVNYRMALVRKLMESGHQVTVLAPPDGHEGKLLAAGCAFEPIGIDGKSLSPVEDAALILRFRSSLKRLKPHVVLGYTIKNNIYGALACRSLKVPFVPNISGLGAAFFASHLLRRLVVMLYHAAFARVPFAFFQNADDRALFISEGIVPRDRALLLPGSGVDLDRFRLEDLPSDKGGARFLLIARMLWEKGVGEFVAAARAIRADHPNAEFGLLGYLDVANPGAISRTQVNEWVASGAVQYHGQTEDVRPFIAAADCIVLPTYYGEGTPRTLIEAGACGRAAITSDAPGCREIVVHEETGYLVKPRDAQALAEAMRKFIALPVESRARLGRAGRARVEREYDEQRVIAAYEDVLAELKVEASVAAS